MSGIQVLWGISICFYGLANILFLTDIWLRSRPVAILANLFGLTGMGSQLTTLVMIGLRSRMFPILNLHDSLGLFSILLMGAYFIARMRWPFTSLGFLAASLAFLASLASYAFPAALPAPTRALSGLVLDIHVSILLVSYAAFALAFCAALAYLLQDGFLRSKHNIQFARRLPPLNALDWLINRLVELGFILLTLGMALGSFWADRFWGSWWSFDPKQDLALFTWLIYAYIIHARTLSGWKGKKLVLFIIFGFFVVVMAFVGTSFLPGKHRFA